MRVLFLGDIVGHPGVAMIKRSLPIVVEKERIDLVIANAENVTGGSGLKPGAFGDLRAAGVELMTMGDHIYKRIEIIPILESETCICRPANYPPQAPGREIILAETRTNTPVAVFCLLGRTFMRSVDCPFQAADRMLAAIPKATRCIFVDIHAEATADKYLMAHYLKGRVSAIFGTHTHVPTADEQILDGGTAYITDVGMTGPYDSILGRQIDRVLSTTISFVPTPFDVAKGDARLAGAIVDVDPATGQSQQIRRYMLDEDGLAALKSQSQKSSS